MKKDITGQKFGRLTAVRPTDDREKATGAVKWECRCECGKVVYVSTCALTSGNTVSCGCYRKELYRARLKRNREKSYIDGTSINAITNKVRCDNSSGYKGINWNKRTKSWTVRIGFKGKRYYIGNFKSLEDAVQARQEAEEKLYKPFLEAYNKGVAKDEK